MERMSLREAAESTGRSITTLRRYIRSGRLQAEKRNGRYGPEYFVSAADLSAAGLEQEGEPRPAPPLARAPSPRALERPGRETLPVSLYQELQMKHEQLLVQYGMIRAAGLRVMELQGDLDEKRRQTLDSHEDLARLKERFARETSALSQRLREAELEIQDRDIEIAALREKARALEMLTRNAVTTETIDREFQAVVRQKKLVDHLGEPDDGPRVSRGPWPAVDRARDPEH